MTDYTFGILADLPDDPAGKVNPEKLEAEIIASAITKTLTGLRTDGDVLTISFDEALTAGDETILHGDITGPAGGLLAAHDNVIDATEAAMTEVGEAGGSEISLPERTSDPVSPNVNDFWIRNTGGVRRFVFYDGTNKHAVVLTQE